jgi:hypothetical protein
VAERHFMAHKILVLVEGEAAKKSHQELFSLPNAQYRAIKRTITEEVTTAFLGLPAELHIAAGWETILSAALWPRTEFSVHDVLALVKKSGKAEDDLSFLEDLDLHDLFFLLCREKRLDLLRGICNAAKASVEWRCGKNTRVHCHLVSEETSVIVASSL